MITRSVRQISSTAWFGGPFLAALAASFVLSIPVRIAGLQAPEPVFALAPVFAWASVKPSIAAPAVVAVLGLLLDLLWGGPIGLWPLSLLSAYTLVFLSRRVLSGQDVAALWVAYAAACGAALGMALVLTDLRAGHLPALTGVGLQFLVTVILFPFAWRLIERYEAMDTRYNR